LCFGNVAAFGLCSGGSTYPPIINLVFYGVFMGKASRRKHEARSKKEIYDLDTYRQFFPNGIEELSVSTTGWIFTLSPALIKKLVIERHWDEFILHQLRRCGWLYCPQTDACYEGFTHGKSYIPNPFKTGLKVKIPSNT
jgi:hypothetical protein